MRNQEKKYADLGKFEELFEILEQEINKSIQRTSRNKDGAYDYIVRALRRMDEDLPRSRSCESFLEEVQVLVRSSRRDEEERDEMFSRGIMDKLKEEFQEAVPNGEYEDVDMNKFMEIAQQMLETFERELREKEEVGFEYGVNGHFTDLQGKLGQITRRMLTAEERSEASGNIKRLFEGAEELEMVKKQGTEVTLGNVTQLFDEFIRMQRQIEESIELNAGLQPKETSEYEQILAGAPVIDLDENPFDTDFGNASMATLANTPIIDLANDSPFDFDNSSQVQEESMENIASTENIEDKDLKVIERDGQKYVITKDAEYDEQGQLVSPGEIRTIEAMNPKTGYVVLPDESGTFNRVLTPEQFLEYHRTKVISRDNPEQDKKTSISEMFL